ncbi:MAG TPA: hypothetical protein PKW56_02490 [Clostridiales bacterium]|nr:hypothetical protein [Clostridiales bacterium]
MLRTSLRKPFILMLLIVMLIPVFQLFAQDEEEEWDENITNTEFLFHESKKEILAQGYYTNGDMKTGYFDETPNVYATFTLYKGNSYAFVIGGANNLNNIRASFYGNNFVENFFNDEVDVSTYKVFYITPIHNGTYYLKVQSFGESEGDGEWMYYYGFKQNQ